MPKKIILRQTIVVISNNTDIYKVHKDEDNHTTIMKIRIPLPTDNTDKDKDTNNGTTTTIPPPSPPPPPTMMIMIVIMTIKMIVKVSRNDRRRKSSFPLPADAAHLSTAEGKRDVCNVSFPLQQFAYDSL